ncbi:MAG TPA: ABC transporter substrate-binding protein [Candidatus Binatia bacterium]|nr:ABC transporter substrate-binding protein [Candidatus Binatia bacterium]
MPRPIMRVLDVLAVAIIALAIYRFAFPRSGAPFPAKPAPSLTLAAMSGGTFSLAGLRGHVVFLDFWASWCEPCKQSLPLVERFAAAHPEAIVVSVDAGEDPRIARLYARAHAIRNVVFDPDMKAADAFAVEGFPTMIAVDADGIERAKWPGFNPSIESLMDRALTSYAKPKRASWLPSAEAATPLTIAIDGDPNTLDTILQTPYGWQLAPLTQGYLFTVDDRGTLVSDLALTLPTKRNGGISADGRTIRYRLRPARWSDGAPFEASDVSFTVDALRNPRTSVPDRSTVAQIERVDVVGPHELAVRLRAPSAGFVASFLTLGANDPFAILPRHVVGSFASLDRSPLDAQTIGLGPYRLRRWQRGASLIFERNPHYWRGPAHLDEIRVNVVADAGTRLTQIRTGELDNANLSGSLLDRARDLPGVRVIEKTTNIVDYLQCNMRSAALRPLAVRRAIAAALDRRKLAVAVYRNLEEPTDSDQLETRYRARLRLPPYDPAAARRELGDRVPVHLELSVAGTWRSSSAAALQIADDLRRAGIEATIHSYTTSVFWGPKDAGGILDSGRYDIALTSWSPSLDPDRSYLFGCIARPPGGGNSMAYCNPAFDRAERRGMRSYDEAARARAYQDAGDILVRDVPVIPIGFERNAYAVSPRFANFKPNVLGRDYWNAWEWELRT